MGRALHNLRVTALEGSVGFPYLFAFLFSSVHSTWVGMSTFTHLIVQAAPHLG